MPQQTQRFIVKKLNSYTLGNVYKNNHKQQCFCNPP